jgi:geranylgeranyl pyrophosphate synthase
MSTAASGSETIKTFESEVEQFLSRVDVMIRDYINEHSLYEYREPHILYEHARKRILSGGKRFRPALALAACEAFSGELTPALPYAVLTEVTHGGYLDLDDVIDQSKLRRGEPSTFVQVGMEQAITIGLLNADAAPWLFFYDGMKRYGWSFETARYLANLIANVKLDTVEGESLDVLYRRSPKLTKAKMNLIYARKTGAYTYGGPAAGGAKIGGASDRDADDLYNTLRLTFGPAFQIIDDVLNVQPEDGKYGKEFADDLNEGKPTWLLAHFNENASEEDKKRFYGSEDAPKFGRLEPPLTLQERLELIELYEKYDAIKEAKAEANRLLSYSLELVKSIVPENEQSKNFYNLLVFGIKRNW